MSEKNKNASLKSLVVLCSICLIVATLLAAIYSITAPRIAADEARAEREALQSVLPEAVDFLRVEGDYPDTVKSVWRDTGGCGYAVMLSVKGYDSSKPMSVAVGFDGNGAVRECRVVSALGETVGIGTRVMDKSFLDQFVGKDHTLDGVDTISGATISSSALVRAVSDAAYAVMTVKEGAHE